MIEQPGPGQHERARADPHDATVAPVGRAQGVDESGRGLGVDVLGSNDDHGVSAGQIAHGAGLAGDETAGDLGRRTGRADLEVVPRVVDVGPVDPEDFAGY